MGGDGITKVLDAEGLRSKPNLELALKIKPTVQEEKKQVEIKTPETNRKETKKTRKTVWIIPRYRP